jgi:hypothetical protein
MVAVLHDPDGQTFQALRETGPGLRLRLAIRESDIALTHMRAARRRLDPKAEASWQRRYVTCCNNASHAIEQLTEAHAWPLEADFEPTFVWVPKKARRWLWQTTT